MSRLSALALAPLLALGLYAPPATARQAVAVIISEDVPEYEVPAQAFAASLGRPIEIHHVRGDKELGQRIFSQLRSDPPPLVFVVGAKAGWLAAHELPHVPAVYAMVLDPDRYGIDGAFVTGVSMLVAPDMALAQFQLFAPKVERLGIILGQSNDSDLAEEAIAAARAAGYDVRVRRVADTEDVRRGFARLRQEIDAIWLLPDPVVITPNNFRHLQAETARLRMPVLAYSEMLVQAGALMCVAPDPDAVGRQAAGLARQVLDGTTAGTIDPPAPDTPRVVLNRDVQDVIGLKLDPVLLDFVDEVVREPTSR